MQSIVIEIAILPKIVIKIAIFQNIAIDITVVQNIAISIAILHKNCNMDCNTFELCNLYCNTSVHIQFKVQLRYEIAIAYWYCSIAINCNANRLHEIPGWGMRYDDDSFTTAVSKAVNNLDIYVGSVMTEKIGF